MSAETSHHTQVFSRQPLSSLSKLSMWAFLIMTIFGAIGAIALTIASGSTSLDLDAAAVCSLLATLLMASGRRWLQLIAILPGAYDFYTSFMEPYALDSLTNPKDMSIGGYYHFIGNVLLGALVIIAFGACVAATVQNFRSGERKAPRWLPTGIGVVVGMAIGALLIGAISQPPAVAGTAYTNGEPTVQMMASSFSQPEVTIPKGSKLLLTDATGAVHILANGSWQGNTPKPEREAGAPVVNNVQVNGKSVEIGPFTTAGTYHIYCSVHPGMNLTIVVQ